MNKQCAVYVNKMEYFKGLEKVQPCSANYVSVNKQHKPSGKLLKFNNVLPLFSKKSSQFVSLSDEY